MLIHVCPNDSYRTGLGRDIQLCSQVQLYNLKTQPTQLVCKMRLAPLQVVEDEKPGLWSSDCRLGSWKHTSS